jgi:bacterioferritin (cytochrome b1)
MPTFNPYEHGARSLQSLNDGFNPLEHGARIIQKPKESIQEPEGDSWPALLGKSATKGLIDIAGLFGNFQTPQQATPETQKIIDKYTNRLTSQEKQMLDSRMPSSADITGYLNEKSGYDLTPRPQGPAQRIASNAVEFGASSLLPFGKFNGLTQLGKQGAVGAGVGAVSGTAQEMGVDPLMADIGASFTPYGAKKIVQGVSAPLKYILPTAEETAIKSLQKQIGQENIPQVLENLDKKLPFDAPSATAEIADNVGLAKMHQAMSPNISSITEKHALGDATLRRKLEELSAATNQTPYTLGETIRDGLENKLKNAEATRAANAKPLMENIKASRVPVSAENTMSYLKEEERFAKGDVKKEINFIKGLLKPNTSTSANNANIIKELEKNIIKYEDSPSIVTNLKTELNKLKPQLLAGDLKGAEAAINAKLQNVQTRKALKTLTDAKKLIKLDLELSGVPEVAEFNKAYARDSKPVSAINTNSLLSKFTDKKTKKNQFNEKEITEFVLSPERVPEKIIASSIDETKSLMKQVEKDPQMLNAVRSSFLDNLLNKSELGSLNADGISNLSYKKFNNFLEKNNGKLTEVFDKNQIKVLSDARDLLKAREKAKTLGRAFGSNTQSETTLLAELTSTPVTRFGNKAAKLMPFGKRLSPIASGMYDKILKTHKQSIEEILKEALSDPQKAKLLLTPTKKIKSTDQLNTILARLFPISDTYREERTSQYPDAITINNMGGE